MTNAASAIDGRPVASRGTISGATRGFLYLVIAAIASFGLPLYLFPSGAGGYWAWTVADPRTAMLIGSVYFVPTIHYSLLLREREWIGVETTLRSLFVVAGYLLVVAMVHWDTFYPWRLLTLSWLFSYYLPLLFLPILFRLQQERFGVDKDIGGRRIAPAWRAWLRTRAVIYFVLVVVMLMATPRVIAMWPWSIETVNARMFSGQVAMFGVFPAYAILDGSWRRYKLFMRLTGMMAVGHLVLLNAPVGAYDWSRTLAVPLMLMPVEWLVTSVGLWLSNRGTEAAR